MLRVLTLATLFPNKAEPTLGNFVERQTLGLAVRPDVELEVVAPVGLPPWPLSLHPHYARRAALTRREEWKGLTVHRPRHPVFPLVSERMTPRWMARALLPLLRDIRARFPFDVIDAEFFWPDGPAAMHLAAALGVPFSVKARGSDISYFAKRAIPGPQILAAADAAGGLLAVSAALKRDMAELGIAESKILVHYTGVDLDRFAPTDRARAKAALGVTGPLVVSVGRLIPRKRHGLALEALAQIPEATLMIVGHGPELLPLEAQARSLGIDARVRFLGDVSHEEVAKVLAAGDVMLLASSGEGLANVWVEAMACGVPVVAADIPGADEAVTPEAGRLTAADPDALAAAVRELIANPPDPRTVRRAAERFSWETNANALFEHLLKVAARS
jgi:glycosyltransferase involved in cell wall biosynthesis